MTSSFFNNYFSELNHNSIGLNYGEYGEVNTTFNPSEAQSDLNIFPKWTYKLSMRK